MKREEGFFLSADGKTQIHEITWEPDHGEIKAVVQLVHGMAEYIQRYDAFASYLAEHGFAVIGHDLLGHGQSVTEPKRLGFFHEENGLNILIDDISAVGDLAEKNWPGKKRILLGHSMGAFLVRRYTALYPDRIDAAVFMGTGWIPGPTASLGLWIAKRSKKKNGPFSKSALLTQLVTGRSNKAFEPARTPFDWLSVNEENVDRYIADDLCGFEFTVGAYADFFQCLKALASGDREERIRKDLPLLIISGALDPVGGAKSCPKVLEHYRKLGLRNVTLKLYENDRHEILNEDDREQVFRDLAEWFDGI